MVQSRRQKFCQTIQKFAGCKANITDSTQPVTVTLLVNQAQAELLSAYEKSASMHFALEYRGDAETAAQYLAVQEEYFRNGGSHE